jgi:hypothetical protein
VADDEPIVWVVHLIWLEALSGGSIECSECSATLFRAVGDSDYVCESCGIIL